MKALVVDDDFASRKILLKYLSEYGQCDISVNGKEAVDVFKLAMEEGEPYDLVCLDIMMPEMDGQTALRQIRELEKEQGKFDQDGAKIIMTTCLDDSDNIKTAFREQCEAYLVKPIDKEKLVKKLKEFELV